MFFERFNETPFINRIDAIKQSLFSQVENKYLSNKDNSHFDYVEDKKTFYDYCKTTVDEQVDSMILTLNSASIYKMLWENIQKYTPTNLNDIKEITLNYLNNSEVKFEDITAIIYIRASLEGFRSYSNMKHILIDECQDYSPLFYEIIKKSFPTAAITIMGDLNQRIDNHSNVKSRNGITDIFDNVKVAILNRSYRSTADITNFAKEILSGGEPIEAVERQGMLPTIHMVKDNNTNNILAVVKKMKEQGYESIAIICKNNYECAMTYSNLSELVSDINLISNENAQFNSGVNVISSYLAKGLEFDGVIIADGENFMDESDKNLFYTACTRALHELHIFTNTDMTSALPQNKNLYKLV